MAYSKHHRYILQANSLFKQPAVFQEELRKTSFCSVFSTGSNGTVIVTVHFVFLATSGLKSFGSQVSEGKGTLSSRPVHTDACMSKKGRFYDTIRISRQRGV